MGIRDSIRNWLHLQASTMPPGLTERGSQQSVSPETSEWQDQAGLAYGVAQPWDLNRHLDLYTQDSTCSAVVNALTSLTLSEITVSSEAAEGIDKAVLEFNRRVGLHNVLDLLLTDYNWAGFGAGEIVLSDDGQDILGIVRIDPRTLRLRVDRFGRITQFIQLPWLIPNAMFSTGAYQPISLDPANILFLSRKPVKTAYGLPVFESCQDDVTARKMLSTLSYRSARALSFPTPVHSLEPDPNGIWRPEDYQEALNNDKAAWSGLEPGDHIHRIGNWKSEVFAPSDHLQQVGEEIENFNSQVIAASGLNANAVGLNYSKGFTPSSVQSKLMVNSLRTTQILLMEELNRKLYRRYSDVYNTPEIYCEMKQPILESQKEEYEAFATLLNNADRLYRAGVIDESTLAQLLGYDQLADPERLAEYIKTQPQPASPVDQSGDRNQQQRNKSELDRRENVNDNPNA